MGLFKNNVQRIFILQLSQFTADVPILKVGRKTLKLCLRLFIILWTVYFIAWMLTLDTVHNAEILFKSRFEKCDSPLSQKYNKFSLSGDR